MIKYNNKIASTNHAIIIGGNNMRIENQYSRKNKQENSFRKSKYPKKMISDNLRIQERRLNSRMKEIERKEKEAWKRAYVRIAG